MNRVNAESETVFVEKFDEEICDSTLSVSETVLVRSLVYTLVKRKCFSRYYQESSFFLLLLLGIVVADTHVQLSFESLVSSGWESLGVVSLDAFVVYGFCVLVCMMITSVRTSALMGTNICCEFRPPSLIHLNCSPCI